jgi:hypothetical protein
MKHNRIIKYVQLLKDYDFVGVGFKPSYAMVGSFVNDHFIVVHRGDASDLFFQQLFYGT